MKSASEEWDILCAITFENTPFRRGLFMDCHKEEYVQKMLPGIESCRAIRSIS